ncbi:hypothetical protein ACFQ07_33555 [Actinomadura adrarensis]|uniref:Uncharacterized protein n=1 Tax=Actinomadura adrarensis TaxID=1819600 RepID=A0ABW3CV01_9ACTN
MDRKEVAQVAVGCAVVIAVALAVVGMVVYRLDRRADFPQPVQTTEVKTQTREIGLLGIGLPKIAYLGLRLRGDQVSGHYIDVRISDYGGVKSSGWKEIEGTLRGTRLELTGLIKDEPVTGRFTSSGVFVTNDQFGPQTRVWEPGDYRDFEAVVAWESKDAAATCSPTECDN